MATIINNPAGTTTEDSSSVGIIVGVLIVILLAVLFYVFVYPSMRSSNAVTAPTDNTTQPAGGSATVNVQLPTSGSNSTAPAAGTNSY